MPYISPTTQQKKSIIITPGNRSKYVSEWQVLKMKMKCILEEGNEYINHDDVLNKKVDGLQEGGEESSRDTGFRLITGWQKQKGWSQQNIK